MALGCGEVKRRDLKGVKKLVAFAKEMQLDDRQAQMYYYEHYYKEVRWVLWVDGWVLGWGGRGGCSAGGASD